MTNQVDTLATIGPLNRVDGTLNKTNQAGDHDAFQQAIDATIVAVQADIPPLSSSIATLEADEPTLDVAGRLSSANAVAPFPALQRKYAGMYHNEPVSGDLTYPIGPLQTWRANRAQGTASGIPGYLTQVVLIGDSITQGNGVCGQTSAPYGYDYWWQRLTRDLAEDIPGAQSNGSFGLAGMGFRGFWVRNNSFWPYEWVIGTGTGNGNWQKIPTTSLADVSPWGEGWVCTGAPTTVTSGSSPGIAVWTAPANFPSVQSVDIYYIDISAAQSPTGSGSTQWYVSINNLSRKQLNGTDIPGTSVATAHDNKLKRVTINAADFGVGTISSVSILPGSTTVAGTAAITGIAPYYTSGGVKNAEGLVVHNLGRSGGALSVVSIGLEPFWRPASPPPPLTTTTVTTSAGNWHALLDLFNSDTGLDLVICECCINDYNGASDTLGSGNLNSPASTTQYAAAQADIAGLIAGYTSSYQVDPNANPGVLAPNCDLLMWSTYSSIGHESVQQQYRNVVKTITGPTYGVPVFDCYDAWSGDYGRTGNTQSQPLLDRGSPAVYIHPNQVGNIDIAARLSRMLRAFS